MMHTDLLYQTFQDGLSIAEIAPLFGMSIRRCKMLYRHWDNRQNRKQGNAQCSACSAWVPVDTIHYQVRYTGPKGRKQRWPLCPVCFEFLNRPITKRRKP